MPGASPQVWDYRRALKARFKGHKNESRFQRWRFVFTDYLGRCPRPRWIPRRWRSDIQLPQWPRHQNPGVRTVTVKIIREPAVDHYSAIIIRRRGVHEVEGAIGGTQCQADM
jgi:hypothetical protein